MQIIQETKLPSDWKFTQDEEGKTQHRIYKEYLRNDGNKEEEIIVTANGKYYQAQFDPTKEGNCKKINEAMLTFEK